MHTFVLHGVPQQIHISVQKESEGVFIPGKLQGAAQAPRVTAVYRELPGPPGRVSQVLWAGLTWGSRSTRHTGLEKEGPVTPGTHRNQQDGLCPPVKPLSGRPEGSAGSCSPVGNLLCPLLRCLWLLPAPPPLNLETKHFTPPSPVQNASNLQPSRLCCERERRSRRVGLREVSSHGRSVPSPAGGAAPQSPHKDSLLTKATALGSTCENRPSNTAPPSPPLTHTSTAHL